MVQPALSQQIRKLEDELGVELLTRTKRRVRLTEPGRVFLREARLTLRQADAAVQAAQRAAAGQMGRLAVGFVETAVPAFAEMVRLYRERHPDVDLTLHEVPFVQQQERLVRGTLDVGLLPPLRPGAADSLTSELLARERLMVALPEEHPLARETSIPIAALADEPFVLFPPALQTRLAETVIGVCARAGFTPRVAQEASQMHSIIALVGAGLGVTLAPASVAEYGWPGVVTRPLADAAPCFELAAAWRADDLSPAAAAFLEVAREVARAGNEIDEPETAWGV